MKDVRQVLHQIADLLADCLERPSSPSSPPKPLSGPFKVNKRRAPSLPPQVERTVHVSENNRARARQALLRRGYLLRKSEDP